MARRIRIEFEGALYHVFNRGNYRDAIFATAGAAMAFESTLGEACARHAWRLHAYVVMRNHFHLALETPRPNLVNGMHWLQGTFATRFNRFRREHGHLFQGRYHALLVEDSTNLARVIDYIHLNPVRANLIPAGQPAAYPYSSLRQLARRPRANWLAADTLLSQHEFEDNARGWRGYLAYLSRLARDPAEQQLQSFDTMAKGWAIGTLGWKRAVASDLARRRIETGLRPDERRELRDNVWRAALHHALLDLGKSQLDLAREPSAAAWKLTAAALLREQVAAPYAWLATELGLGQPATLRSTLWRRRRMQRATA